MILFLLSLLAGILTVLAPCTISLLPVIVGGSVAEGGQSIKRPLVVTASLGISVVLFTLILKVSTAFVHIPQEFWQLFSGIIIFGLGLTMIFPSLYDKLPWVNKINQESNKLLATGYNKKNMTGDIIMGAALGPVFSSCSPTYFLILATVLPLSFAAGIVDLLAYAVGLSGGLLVVAFAGQKLMQKLGVASDPKGWIKRSIGILFLIVGLAICFGLDKKVETAITNAGYFDVTTIEQKFIKNDLSNSSNTLVPTAVDTSNITVTKTPDNEPSTTGTVDQVAATKMRVGAKSLEFPVEPEITNPSAFINTDGAPITLAQFKGKKVVLVDFWTYSCINCQRTLPYVKAWDDKYSSQGLEIVSIHTPEFAFEKDQANVQKAVTDAGIKYPVVMDNNYGTWNAFDNNAWPHKYLIDIDGFVVYDHAGEGEYDVTEAAIQKALAERASVLGLKTSSVPKGTVAPAGVVGVNGIDLGSPETYFGSNRNEYLSNGVVGASGTSDFTIPDENSIELNHLYLGGTWNVTPEYAETKASAKIVYKYQAKNVYFVSSSKNGTKAHVLIDGKPMLNSVGTDVVADGSITIQDNKLYHLISGKDYAPHTIEIDIDGGGLDAYTFTFG